MRSTERVHIAGAILHNRSRSLPSHANSSLLRLKHNDDWPLRLALHLSLHLDPDRQVTCSIATPHEEVTSSRVHVSSSPLPNNQHLGPGRQITYSLPPELTLLVHIILGIKFQELASSHSIRHKEGKRVDDG